MHVALRERTVIDRRHGFSDLFNGVPMGDLGRRLREARDDAGVSLSAVAARGGYSVAHLCNVEAGR